MHPLKILYVKKKTPDSGVFFLISFDYIHIMKRENYSIPIILVKTLNLCKWQFFIFLYRRCQYDKADHQDKNEIQ